MEGHSDKQFNLFNTSFGLNFQKHNEDSILTENPEAFVAQQYQQPLFHHVYFSFWLFSKETVQRLRNVFIYIHNVEEEKWQRDSTLCFLMKRFPSGAQCPFFPALLTQLSIKQDVKKSDPDIRRCQDL